MSLVIRKKVELDFLGEEYKNAYLVFKAIPLKDYEELIKKSEAIKDDRIKSVEFLGGTIKQYFLEGKANDEEVKAEDLDDLDAATIIKCFGELTGQSINEDDNFLDKASNKPSSTTEDSPSPS